MIYNMTASILLGKTTKDDIKKVVELAKEHDLLSIVKEEFGDIGRILGALTPNPLN